MKIIIRQKMILTVLLILMLLFLMPAMTATAEEIPSSGQCGAALFWEFNADSGILTIHGTGEMTDFGSLYDADGQDISPWSGEEYRYKIKKVVMEPGITSIGNHAFQGIAMITEIEMPEGITRIGEKAFFSCAKITGITIPESVQQIGTAAFFGCRNLQQVTIPAGMTEVSQQVFSDCISLKEITIPDGVTTIGSFAFASCEQLARITIPASVIEIRWNAFEHCDSLSDVQYMGSQEQWKQIIIKDHNDDLVRAYLQNKTDVEPAPVPDPAPTPSPAPVSKPRIISRMADSIHSILRILLKITIVLAFLAIAVYLAAFIYSKKQQEKISSISNKSEETEKTAGTPPGLIKGSDPDSVNIMIPDETGNP